MTITPGQLGHTDDHTLLVDQLKGEITRFGLTPDPKLGGPYALGDPGHIEQHNITVAELQRVATTGGITIPALPAPAALGHVGHIHDHELMRAALDIIRQADAYNAATGGTVTEHWDGSKMWRIHTFTTNDTLQVAIAAQPFKVFAIGGGGGGSAVHHAHGNPAAGGGAEHLEANITLTLGTHSVEIGSGGGGGHGGWQPNAATNDGGPGGRSGFDVTGWGVAGGGKGGNSQTFPPNAPEVTTTIRGTAETFGGQVGGLAPGSRAGQGGGGSQSSTNGLQSGGNGAAGLVVVAYRVK